jgi:2-polyprenyl-3-methyl-5-hydroxy-6-metoxy-1,4-benzoquinol methylase
MAMDPSKIAFNNKLIFTPWEIVFSIAKYIKIIVELSDSSDIKISDETKRKSLAKHAALIMKEAIWFENWLKIHVDEWENLSHIWFWSSSRLMAWVASAINEIYWKPIGNRKLVKYLAQNHWEEIEWNDKKVMPVQCIWGSAANWLFKWAFKILAWESELIFNVDIPKNLKVIVGVPRDFKKIDSKMALDEEMDNIDWFINTWKKYSENTAYKVLHILMPAAISWDFKKVWDVIENYRYDKWSIKNCSFLYPEIVEKANKLRELKEKWLIDVVSMSSVWPSMFCIWEDLTSAKREMNKLNMETYEFNFENDSYKIINSVWFNKKWNDKNWIKSFKNKEPDPIIEQQLDLEELEWKKALDIGCWWGRHIDLLLKKGIETYWLDSSEWMVDISKKVAWKNNIKLWWIWEKLNFEDRKFDFIVSTWVLHHAKNIKEFEETLKDIHRIMKKWWKFYFNIFTSDFIDKDLNKITDSLYTTDEWFHMFLLKSDEIKNIFKKLWFEIVEDFTKEYKSDIWFAERSILKTTFIKK